MQGNTLLKVPQLLDANMHDRQRPTILATGQVTINEGYAAAVKEGVASSHQRRTTGLRPGTPAAARHLKDGNRHALRRKSPEREVQPTPPTSARCRRLRRRFAISAGAMANSEIGLYQSWSLHHNTQNKAR